MREKELKGQRDDDYNETEFVRECKVQMRWEKKKSWRNGLLFEEERVSWWEIIWWKKGKKEEEEEEIKGYTGNDRVRKWEERVYSWVEKGYWFYLLNLMEWAIRDEQRTLNDKYHYLNDAPVRKIMMMKRMAKLVRWGAKKWVEKVEERKNECKKRLEEK